MGAGVPAGLNKAPFTAAAGRKFGFTVGIAFLVIGGILMWRQHPMKSYVALGLGGSLILGALVAPTLLGPVERAWMGLAHLISKVTTPIFMGIVYFIVVTPAGLIRSRGGRSPIHRERGKSQWHEHKKTEADGTQMERQF